MLRQAQFKACSQISKNNLFDLPYPNTLQDPIWEYVCSGVFDDIASPENNIPLQLIVLANILSPIAVKDIPNAYIKQYNGLFDYYIRNAAVEYFTSDLALKMFSPIVTARLDIKNSGSGNSIEVLECSDANAVIDFPKWYEDETGKGFYITSNCPDVKITIKCINDGKLYINFKGIDFKDKNWKRVNVAIGYKNIQVFNSDNSLKCTFDDIESVSHDHHQTLSFPVNDNDQFIVSFTAVANVLFRDDILRIMHAVFGDLEAIDSLEV